MIEKNRSKVAFLGLGRMGKPMAENLLKAGYTVKAYDIDPKARELFEGECAKSCSEAFEGANIVITMLPNGENVRNVFLDSNNFKTTAKKCVAFDMSSSSPFDTVKLGNIVDEHVRLMDAPVSGGVLRAKQGTLSMMVGGQSKQLKKHEPLLKVLTSSIFLCGPLGTGHAMKALNNYVSAAGMMSACEALFAAQTFGIDPALCIDILNASTGMNYSTKNKIKQMILSKHYNSGFGIQLQAKDVNIAESFSKDLDLKLSLLSSMSNLLNIVSSKLPTDADHTEIFKYLENKN